MARKRSFLEEARGRRVQPEKKGGWSEEKYNNRVFEDVAIYDEVKVRWCEQTIPYP